MVVDGQSTFVGSRSREAWSVIESAALQPKITIQLSAAPATNDAVAFDVTISNLSILGKGQEAELWIAITEKGLHTNVKAGENSGENLQHAAVVRILRKENSFSGTNNYQAQASAKLDPAWQRDHLSFVAFAVEKDSRKIIGAASTKL